MAPPVIERAAVRRTRTAWSTLVGLVLVPVVIAAAFAWGLHRPADHLSRIHAAVVNLDEPAEVDDRTLPLGRQVVAALTAGVGLDGKPLKDQQPDLDWTLTDRATAQAGLEDGGYAVVLTIPRSFSTDATSLADQSTDKITRADLQVATSDNAPISDAAVARLVSVVVSAALGRQITQTYVDNIYVSFSSLHDAAADATRGARRLGAGSQSLVDGLDRAAGGTDDLVTGLAALRSGSSGLVDGSAALADGARTSAAGASTLSAGLERLNRASTTLPAQTKALARGVDTVADDTGALSTSLTTLGRGLDQASDGARRLSAATTVLSTDAAGLSTASQEVDGAAQQVRTATAAALASCRAQADADCTSLERLVTVTRQLAAGTEGLADGAGKLSAGASTVATQGRPLAAGIAAAARGSDEAASDAAELSRGARTAADGADDLARATPALTRGVSDAADGAEDLDQGDARIATGARALSDGAAKVSAGTTDAVGAARELAQGARSLQQGAHDLNRGAGSLASGLDRITKEVPDYTSAQRASVAQVAASPVGTQASKGTTADGALAYLCALALGISALVTYLVLAAVSSTALSSREGALRLALGAFAPVVPVAAAQAVLVGVVLDRALDLSSSRALGVAAVAFLGGLVLNAVNQALVAWLGGVGRLVSLAALAVSAPAALISTVPPVLATITSFTPIQPFTDALRRVVVTGTVPGGTVTALAAWLLAGLLATALATARRRSVRYAQLVPRRRATTRPDWLQRPAT